MSYIARRLVTGKSSVVVGRVVHHVDDPSSIPSVDPFFDGSDPNRPTPIWSNQIRDARYLIQNFTFKIRVFRNLGSIEGNIRNQPENVYRTRFPTLRIVFRNTFSKNRAQYTFSNPKTCIVHGSVY